MQNKKDAKLYMRLEADSGYVAEVSCRVSPQQWFAINRIVDVPEQTYRHIKSGGLYKLLHIGRAESDGVEMVVYQNGEGVIFVRPKAEFDEKFQSVQAA